jgi:hypothetical protein
MLMRRRRPLLGAAMIGGTAYVAGKRRQDAAYREGDQEARLDELEAQQQPAPPPTAAGGGTDVVGQLQQLSELKQSGVLSDEEFDAAKRKLLAG